MNTGSTQGGQSIAIGYDAQTKGDQSVGLGANVRASGNSSIAIGGDDLNKVAGTNNNIECIYQKQSIEKLKKIYRDYEGYHIEKDELCEELSDWMLAVPAQA